MVGHPDSDVCELTLEEAGALAIELQKNGCLAQAEQLYRLLLERVPDHPAFLHYSGVLAHQQGRREDALALIERSLALRPNQADWHSNLGIVLQAAGSLSEAAEAYRRAIAIDPGHANAHSNLGVALRAIGLFADAERAYRTAIHLNPGHADAYVNLGILLNGLNRTEEAAACYCKAITVGTKDCRARKLLVLAHCTLGEIEEAVTLLEEWLREEPDSSIALHMLAACTARAVPARASNEFIEETFDSFAATFESKLERLSYQAPALVAAMLNEAGLEPLRRLDVLDAGCGTGLCGPLLAPYARQLIGIDLSREMLARAGEKRVYDALLQTELTDYLRASGAAFDVIVSADVLVYFGDLEPVVVAAAGALRPNGLFVFTLEHATSAAADFTYRLEFHGRYSHGQAYVQELLEQSGLQTRIVHAQLRMEAGAPVPGLVILARKPASA